MANIPWMIPPAKRKLPETSRAERLVGQGASYLKELTRNHDDEEAEHLLSRLEDMLITAMPTGSPRPINGITRAQEELPVHVLLVPDCDEERETEI